MAAKATSNSIAQSMANGNLSQLKINGKSEFQLVVADGKPEPWKRVPSFYLGSYEDDRRPRQIFQVSFIKL